MSDQQAALPERKRPTMSWWVWGLVILMAAFILFPHFARTREKRHATSCLSNLKQIGLASLMYASDHDGAFVRMRGWDEALHPYTKRRELFHCPQDPREDTLSYTMNRHVSGLCIPTVESEDGKGLDLVLPEDPWFAVTFFDGEGLEVIERHNSGAYYAYLDGHAKWLADPPDDSGLFVGEERTR